jgi:hypothetical protein
MTTDFWLIEIKHLVNESYFYLSGKHWLQWKDGTFKLFKNAFN